MKRLTSLLYILIILNAICHVATAQKLMTGRLVDAETKKGIADGTVMIVGTDVKATSNALGFFQLEVNGKTKLQISCEGYMTLTVDFSGEGNLSVQIPRALPEQTLIQRQVQTPNAFPMQSTPAQGGLPKEPTFPGGYEALHKYIRRHMDQSFRPPRGTVMVQMLIDTSGAVVPESVTIIKSLCKPCDRAAVKVMKKSPKWNPAEPKSEVRVVVPISFN